MFRIYRFICTLLVILTSYVGQAQPVTPVIVRNTDEIIRLDSDIQYIEDVNHNILLDSAVTSNNYKIWKKGVPNLGITSSAYWVRLKIKNETNSQKLALRISYPGLDSVLFCEEMASGYRIVQTGESYPFSQREYKSSDYIFSLTIPESAEKLVYMHVCSKGALLLPVNIGNETKILDTEKSKDIFWGMYIGLMVAMLLYNWFVYLTTKDNSYLYYIVYVLAVLLTQTTLSGYAYRLFWPGSIWLARSADFLTPILVGFAVIGFMRHFLRTRTYLPKADKISYLFVATYTIALIAGLAQKYNITFNVIDMSASTISIYMLTMAFIISRKGYRPAVFFFIAWLVFLIGVFIFVFKNFNLLPYNYFTIYTMPVGSAMEALLLSFALADRINTLKKEKELSQAQTVDALKENARIIREQNVMLEIKVTERTQELKIANADLSTALVELKEAETQLVESEKMASLGQLTAGIAHEINNPINFVSSNVMPLNRDVKILLETVDIMEKIISDDIPVAEKKKQIEEYKAEIDYDYLKVEIEQLLQGIGEGASRTAEIVKGLRIFSRLDEDDLKKTDINEGLDSTLVITNNLVGNTIKVNREYSGLPMVECYPGKLNQVFLNIISNAIYAIKKKFGENKGGLLTITTSYDENSVFIKFTDNGTGMDENTKKRLFEPFFTTKDVGEGTGLGLSISYNTIVKHNGQIQVNSEIGIGTEFILTLPLTQK